MALILFCEIISLLLVILVYSGHISDFMNFLCSGKLYEFQRGIESMKKWSFFFCLWSKSKELQLDFGNISLYFQ